MDHLTLGSARCPHSMRQSTANSENGIATLFCDAILSDDYNDKVLTDIQKMCHNLRSGSIESANGVPLNISCPVNVTNEAIMDGKCTMQTGYNADFGKPTKFEQMDTNKDGIVTKEEFDSYEKK